MNTQRCTAQHFPVPSWIHLKTGLGTLLIVPYSSSLSPFSALCPAQCPLLVGLANGRHQQETERWERDVKTFIPPSHSLWFLQSLPRKWLPFYSSSLTSSVTLPRMKSNTGHRFKNAFGFGVQSSVCDNIICFPHPFCFQRSLSCFIPYPSDALTFVSLPLYWQVRWPTCSPPTPPEALIPGSRRSLLGARSRCPRIISSYDQTTYKS